MTESTELITTEIQGLTPAVIFQPETMDTIIKGVREKARSFVSDVTTIKGRKAIASNSSDVARSKTFLDGWRKKLVSEWKDKAKSVDIEGKKMRDAFDALKVEVRQPLTDWEEEEEERIEKIKGELRAIKAGRVFTGNETVNEVDEKLKLFKSITIDNSFDEFKEEIKREIEQTLMVLSDKLTSLRQHEKDQAELAELRAAKAKKEQEEKVAREAQERKEARLEEDKLFKEAAKRLKREAKEKAEKKAEAKAKAEIERIEREKQEEVRRREEAEAKVKKAEQDAKDAKEKRLADIELAKKREREQIEAERLAKEEEDRKRREDEAHRGKVKAFVLADLKKCLNDDEAERVFDAIADGFISHVSINY